MSCARGGFGRLLRRARRAGRGGGGCCSSSGTASGRDFHPGARHLLGFFTPGAQPPKVVGGLPRPRRRSSGFRARPRPNTYGAGTGVNSPSRAPRENWLETPGPGRRQRAAPHHARRRAPGRDWTHRRCGGVDQAGILPAQGASFDRRHRRRRPVPSRGVWRAERAGELEPAQTLTTTFHMGQRRSRHLNAPVARSCSQSEWRRPSTRAPIPLPRKAGSLHRMNVAGCISTVAVGRGR